MQPSAPVAVAGDTGLVTAECSGSGRRHTIPDMSTSAPSAEVAQAAALAQLGRTTAEIAAVQAVSQRTARRRLEAARKAGLVTAPATAPDSAAEPPKRKPARAKVLSAHTGQEIRSARSRERGILGPDRVPGALDEHGRVLVGVATGEARRMTALDAYREGPPPGATHALIEYADGSTEKVAL